MQKNEFEKQVQQQMEELNLPPSDAVWQNIEARIAHTKRRKSAWIFFMALLICLSGGGYFLRHSGSNPTINSDKNFTQNSAKENNLHPPGVSLSQKISPQKKSAKKMQAADAGGSIPKGKEAELSSELIKKQKSNFVKNLINPGKVKNTPGKVQPAHSEKKLCVFAKSSTRAIVINPVEYINQVPGVLQDKKQDSTMIQEPKDQGTMVIKSDTSVIKFTDSLNKYERLKDQNKLVEQTHVFKLTAVKNSLQWGLTFSAGVSGIPTNFLGSLDKSYSAADALNSYPTTGYPSILPSNIKSSGALTAGFFAEKNISKKKLVTIGVNYKMFSSTNKIGERNAGSRSYSLNNPVSTYHNYFHFIEIPVSLKVQISSGRVPLFWEGGFSVSQLISSNALQFDNASLFYYQKNSFFNKPQVGFSSGLSVSLFPKQKIPVLIGPYIFYGTTKIASEGLYKNQHFTFIGLRTQMLLKK